MFSAGSQQAHMHMESLVLDVPTSNFVRYLAVYGGLDLQNVQAFFLATKGVPYGTKEEFLTAMGTLPDDTRRRRGRVRSPGGVLGVHRLPGRGRRQCAVRLRVSGQHYRLAGIFRAMG